MGARVLVGYLLALITMVVLYGAGLALGVRLPLTAWLTLTGLVLVGLIPFAAGGVLLGHAVPADSIGPVMGGVTSVLGVLGGAWGPVAGDGTLGHLSRLLPSYWLVEAGRVAAGGEAWPMRGWITVAAWAVAATIAAGRAFEHDTRRV